MALNPLDNAPRLISTVGPSDKPAPAVAPAPANTVVPTPSPDGFFGPAQNRALFDARSTLLGDPSSAPPDVTSIPDVATLEAQIHSGQLNPLQANRAITSGYSQFARDFQNIIDPSFARSGTPPSSASVLPNWFGFAPHASEEVGSGLVSASVGLELLHGVGGDGEAMKKLTAKQSLGAQILGDALKAAGLPGQIAQVLGVVLGAGNLDAFKDPRTLIETADRAVNLLAKAPGNTLVDKTDSILRTLEHTLGQGNRDIYGDVAGAAQQYLTFRQGLSPVTPDAVLNGFQLPGSNPADSRKAYDYALAHSGDRPPPSNFGQTLGGMDDRNFMVAAFALYEKAGQTSDLATKNQLIATANNLTAYREQHDAVAPAFDPKSTQPGEVDRGLLMQVLTPTIQLPISDHSTWTFSHYAPDRSHNPFASPLASYNWGKFDDRWPAIMNAFQTAYKDPSQVWNAPPALPDVGWWS